MPPTTRSKTRMSGGTNTFPSASLVPLPPSPSAPPVVLSPLTPSIASDRSDARFDAITLEMARSNDLARQSSDLQRQEIARLTALISSIAVSQQPSLPPAQAAPALPIPTASAASIPSALPSHLPPLMIPPPPKPFSGSDRTKAESIVTSAETVFDLNPVHFPSSDITRALYFSSFLEGDAHQWYENLRSSNAPVLAPWATFRLAFLRDWGTQSSSADAYTALFSLRQTSSVISHTATFNSLLNRIPTAPLDPALLVSVYLGSLHERHRQTLNHTRVNRYGGNGAWPTVYDLQEAACDLDDHASSGYSSAVTTRPRPLPVHNLSTSEYPALPRPAMLAVVPGLNVRSLSSAVRRPVLAPSPKRPSCPHPAPHRSRPSRPESSSRREGG